MVTMIALQRSKHCEQQCKANKRIQRLLVLIMHYISVFHWVCEYQSQTLQGHEVWDTHVEEVKQLKVQLSEQSISRNLYKAKVELEVHTAIES